MPYLYPDKSVLLALPGLNGRYRLMVGDCGVAPAMSVLPRKVGLEFRVLKSGLYSAELEHRAKRHAARGRPHLLTYYDLARPVMNAAARGLSSDVLASEDWCSLMRDMENAEGFLGRPSLPSARSTYGNLLPSLPLADDDALDQILDDPRFGPPEPPPWIVEEVGRLAQTQATQAPRSSEAAFQSELWMVACCAADAWLADPSACNGLIADLEIAAEAFHRWSEPRISKRLLATADALLAGTTPHFVPLIRRAFVRLVDMDGLWNETRRSSAC